MISDTATAAEGLAVFGCREADKVSASMCRVHVMDMVNECIVDPRSD